MTLKETRYSSWTLFFLITDIWVKTGRDDFQITLHLQDDLKSVSDTGNIFLTNIHRVFESDVSDYSAEDEDTSDIS
jgi:hypothetical protein